jgi:hypothetical protein
MGLSESWPIIAWGLTVAALMGQNWANTRTMKQRQDDTNAHLRQLNSKTFDSHREIGQLIGAMQSLPCRTKSATVDECEHR